MKIFCFYILSVLGAFTKSLNVKHFIHRRSCVCSEFSLRMVESTDTGPAFQSGSGLIYEKIDILKSAAKNRTPPEDDVLTALKYLDEHYDGLNWETSSSLETDEVVQGRWKLIASSGNPKVR